MAGSFAARLRGLRLAGGWSQRELAEGADQSESAVRGWERGDRAPCLESAARLAVALGQPLSVWEGCLDLGGAYRLPPGRPHAVVLEFGQYKGRRLSEVPTGYLEWLAQEQPRKLPAGQLLTVRRLLAERDTDKRVGDAQRREAERAEAQAVQKAKQAARGPSRPTRNAARLAEAEVRRLEIEEQRLARRAAQLQPPTRTPPAPLKLDDTTAVDRPPSDPPS